MSQSPLESEPPAEDRSTADQIFQSWIDATGDRGKEGLERLCAKHPGEAQELRKQYAEWRVLEGAFGHTADTPAAAPDESDLSTDALLRDAPELEGFKVLEPCLLYRRIGRGGMGVVYHGRHLNLEVEVAVKCLLPHLGDQDPDFRERFQREAKLAARLDHPNVVRVFDVTHKHGLDYLVMEFIAGETAEERVQRKGPLGVLEALRITLGAAEGLAAAHAIGMVHRDVKPANVLIGSDGRIKLADLGLAKSDIGALAATRASVVMGTPQFMAPEQWRSFAEAGAPADVYALGVTLHYLLTGEIGLGSGELADLLDRVRNEPFPDPRKSRDDVPDDVAAIVERCTRKESVDRYPDASEVVPDLRAALKDASDQLDPDENAQPKDPSRATVSPPPKRTVARIKVGLANPERAQRLRSSKRVLVAVAAGAVLLLGGFFLARVLPGAGERAPEAFVEDWDAVVVDEALALSLVDDLESRREELLPRCVTWGERAYGWEESARETLEASRAAVEQRDAGHLLSALGLVKRMTELDAETLPEPLAELRGGWEDLYIALFDGCFRGALRRHAISHLEREYPEGRKSEYPARLDLMRRLVHDVPIRSGGDLMLRFGAWVDGIPASEAIEGALLVAEQALDRRETLAYRRPLASTAPVDTSGEIQSRLNKVKAEITQRLLHMLTVRRQDEFRSISSPKVIQMPLEIERLNALAALSWIAEWERWAAPLHEWSVGESGFLDVLMDYESFAYLNFRERGDPTERIYYGQSMSAPYSLRGNDPELPEHEARDQLDRVGSWIDTLADLEADSDSLARLREELADLAAVCERVFGGEIRPMDGIRLSPVRSAGVRTLRNASGPLDISSDQYEGPVHWAFRLFRYDPPFWLGAALRRDDVPSPELATRMGCPWPPTLSSVRGRGDAPVLGGVPEPLGLLGACRTSLARRGGETLPSGVRRTCRASARIG